MLLRWEWQRSHLARKRIGMGSVAKPWHDRRKSHRVLASNPIRFEWLMPGGGLVSARGVTRDVSSGGVYSYIGHALAVGLDLEFDVLFQPTELAGDKPLMFRCQGRVVRLEGNSSPFGVVVGIRSRHVIDAGRQTPRGHERVIPPAPIVAEYGSLQ